MIAAVLAGASGSAPGGGKQGSKQGGKPQRGKKRAPESSQPTLSKFFCQKVE